MSSTGEQPEIEQASSSSIDIRQDVGRIALSNCLRLLSLEDVVGLINSQWAEGHYDPEIQYSGNGYVVACMSQYVKQDLFDVGLTYQFIDDFGEWEEEDWKAVGKQI